MAKCDECRSADTLPLAGDKVCCLACGHTGDPAPSPTPVSEAEDTTPVAEPSDAEEGE